MERGRGDGRGGAGSRPHLGVDAIVKAGPVLTAVGELDAGLAARGTPWSGGPRCTRP